MTSSNANSANDESAVRAVLDGIYAAWAGNDADAFVAAYADDATATMPGGFLGSKQAIHTTMAAGFAGPLKGSRGVVDVRNVRFVGSDTAVVNATSATVMAGDAEPPAGQWAMDTWTLSRADGPWRVDAYHTCPTAAN
ncbi:DUF4440 domain-containing protein [Amycolatopsis sp. WAC 01376]|uniref:SgcJ/EcaC family oxidoreductase n=1 Tax=Amycolatopsis sp. WAC 01376 TaxID=2203195 RepID=UPI000F7A4731|nr:SgcJ/EcaC family oxidoreductase [Amycolatopsis sp. WAC 01376]RSM53536.1 DUF4440 domain-containing protein [Amycolatopsis sp. WAC 01376]